MLKSTKLSTFFALVILATGLGSTYATAAEKPANKLPVTSVAAVTDDPDPAANPVLASIKKIEGTKLYYLGTRGGLDGWLIVKGGQLQIAYTQTGSQNLIIGALFGPSGENISSAQVQSILDAHPDLKNMFLSEIQSNANTTTGIPATAGGGAGDPMVAVKAAQTQAIAALTSQAAMMGGTGLPAATVALSPPGERLMKDLQNAASVSVGNSTAPQVLMVMDPTCPHCKATWKMLRDKVIGNALQIRLIPISRNGSGGDEERVAAQLLHVANPLQAWDKYVEGDKTQLDGTPEASLIQAIRGNQTLVESWKISHTPFLVYRGKDGKVKILEGEPEKVESLLGDLL